MRGALAFLVLAACWTGPDQPATAPPPPVHVRHHAELEIALERTPCMGACPTYRVVIHADGQVEWNGLSNVAAMGVRRGRVRRGQLDVLARALNQVRFYERDEHGQIPVRPICTQHGHVFSCTSSITVCTDTSHAIVTVRRGHRMFQVEDEHCTPSPLDALEARIDDIAGTARWIGR